MVTLEGIFLWTNHPYHEAQGLVRKRVGHWTILRAVETPVPDSKSNPIQSNLWGQHGHKHYHLLYIIFTFPWRNSTQSANLRLLPNLSLRQCPSSIICTIFIGPKQDGDRFPKVVDVLTEVGIERLAVTLAKAIKSWIYFACDISSED